MFTEGSFKWVREEEGSANRRDSCFSRPAQRFQSDTLGTSNCGHGFRLPSPVKFQSGHLPSGVIPVSRAMPGSDMDISTDSDDEVYGRYSLDSSPQDDKVSKCDGLKHTNSMLRQANCASDPPYSEVGSSRGGIELKQGHDVERLGSGGGMFPITRSGFTDDESSDSVASSEVSSMPFRRNNGRAGQQGTYIAKGFNPSVHLQQKVKRKQLDNGFRDFRGSRLHSQELFDDFIPSAPSFYDSVQKINQVEQIPTFRTDGLPCPENSNGFATTDDLSTIKSTPTSDTTHDSILNRIRDPSSRTAGGVETAVSSHSLPARLPTFHASGLGPWSAVISYDACVRLCLYLWAKGFVEAPIFLDNECMLLRNAFGLQQVLLQSEEELLWKPPSELSSEGASLKPKKTFSKMKVQVRKVKLALDPPTGCSFSSLKPPLVQVESLQFLASNVRSTLSSGWGTLRRVRVVPRIPENSSFSRQSLAYMHAGTQYIKEVSRLLKTGVTNLRKSSSSYEVVQESYSCLLKLKSLPEGDAVKIQPGSGETHVFLPDGLGDDLVIEVHDSKGKYCGRAVVQVAAIAENPGDKLRWWFVYLEPEHEVVGRIQLYINYSTTSDENSHLKCGSVAETVAYDFVLEVAMKVQHFQERNLLLHGHWKWLVTEFASYYGVSDAYSKLRYLSYVMDVATPTADCLSLVHELLVPVVMKGNVGTLSHQENRILGEVFDRLEEILALVFENYKSLDESSQSGMVDVFRPATGLISPALEPALKLYNLMRDILSPEAQLKLCRYFQTAAKRRSRMHLLETDELVSKNSGSTMMDSVALSTAYQKMKSICSSIKNEIFTDIEIHTKKVLPSFLELPNLSSSIYSVELCRRLREFLVACPPTGPSPSVTELVIATADFQKDLACWNINPIKGGVDAKDLFDLYILLWIQDKRLSLLESCKLDKGKCSSIRTKDSTTPFIDDMYDRLRETLNEYEVIVRCWPEYTFILERAIADVEKAILETLDKQYADVLSPLKENLTPIQFGLKYVQKIAKGTAYTYTVPEELGVLLNSLKRMLDVLRPKIEVQLKLWGSCNPDSGNTIPGEHLSEVTVTLRTKFRNYLQALVEKLAENTRVQSLTKLTKIIQDSKEGVIESDIRSRMQPLKVLLMKTIDCLHAVFETQLFIIICRGFWDQMGQDVLKFLEKRKENGSWYKGSRVALSVLDDTFASEMQQLLGNALHEKDLEPPRSIMAVHSMLCEDSVYHNDNSYYY